MDSITQQDNINKDRIIEAVKKMADFMYIDCQVEIKEEVDDKNIRTLAISIYAPEDGRLIIGKNGQNLKSFESVLKAMFLRRMENINNISLDVNDYNKSKTMHLVDMARQTVTRVRSTQKAEAMTPMSAYERRIVHMELASYPDIATESIGAEPNRRIVIKPYP